MIDHIRTVTAPGTYPYQNLALEACLLEQVEPGECILYLWQNRRTVVVGRNQNCWQECRVEALEADGGFVVRRLSGGGAVFHDLGNLNFTFLVRQENYDVSRQLDVILKAVQSFGIPAEKSGRNDLTAQGRKFSGNAFYRSGDHCYHHGTLLIQVNREELSKYLNVSAAKLQSKGVASVQSRVANLTEFCPEITPNRMQKALIRAFGEVYGLEPSELPPERIPKDRLQEWEKKFSSQEWIFGRPIPFSAEFSGRFGWGDITLRLQVEIGKIMQSAAFSDAMEEQFISALPAALEGAEFSPKIMREAVLRLGVSGTPGEQMAEDIASLLQEI